MCIRYSNYTVRNLVSDALFNILRTYYCQNLVKKKKIRQSPLTQLYRTKSVSYTHLDVYKRQALLCTAYTQISYVYVEIEIFIFVKKDNIVIKILNHFEFVRWLVLFKNKSSSYTIH